MSPQIIVGTPGRVLDIFNRNRLLILKELEVLVLDEADTLLDMGFRQSINQVLSFLYLYLFEHCPDRLLDLVDASQTKANWTVLCDTDSRTS
jgi:superfamily II DNA/RNA helicase